MSRDKYKINDAVKKLYSEGTVCGYSSYTVEQSLIDITKEISSPSRQGEPALVGKNEDKSTDHEKELAKEVQPR